MVVLAFLLHPATSPFAEHYYNFKAKSQLKQLHDSCKLVWAADGHGGVSPEDAGEQGAGTKCNLATAVLSPYDFPHDKNVDIKIENSTKSGFTATAKHKEGARTARIKVERMNVYVTVE